MVVHTDGTGDRGAPLAATSAPVRTHARLGTIDRFAFDSFGVALQVDVRGPEHLQLARAVEAILPPVRTPMPHRAGPLPTLALTAQRDRFRLTGPSNGWADFDDLTDALHALDREIRAIVSLTAPDHVFIHAGVVAGPAGAVVIPGRSFAGKTTLVAALVESGATYLSDEYAVLDRSGSVWPYPRPLSLRTSHGRRDVDAATLGAVAGQAPVDVAVVVSTSYRPGATWEPRDGTAADCALALLDNAVAARTRSEVVLATVSQVARRCRHLHGHRGDATTAATDLLHLITGPSVPERAYPAHPGPDHGASS